MPTASPDTDELLARTAHGDRAARNQLMTRHRARLRKMVGYHLDRRLRARVDPSDVVQDVMAEASRKLPEYLDSRSRRRANMCTSNRPLEPTGRGEVFRPRSDARTRAQVDAGQSPPRICSGISSD